MRHDDVGHELGQRLGDLAAVLVDVDDRMSRGELTDPIELDVLGATELGDLADRVPRVDTETGSPDKLPGEPKIADQLGDAGHQAHDPCLVAGGLMQGADGVSQGRLRRARHRPARYMLRRYSPPTS